MDETPTPAGAPVTLAELLALFDARGGQAYSGEPVSQTEHALQCALLARAGFSSDC